MKRLLFIALFAVLLSTTAGSSSYYATSTFTVTITIVKPSQLLADSAKASYLEDYARTNNLAIYQSDGLTVNSALVEPAVQAHIKARFKAHVKSNRLRVAQGSSNTSINSEVETDIP